MSSLDYVLPLWQGNTICAWCGRHIDADDTDVYRGVMYLGMEHDKDFCGPFCANEYLKARHNRRQS